MYILAYLTKKTCGRHTFILKQHSPKRLYASILKISPIGGLAIPLGIPKQNGLRTFLVVVYSFKRQIKSRWEKINCQTNWSNTTTRMNSIDQATYLYHSGGKKERDNLDVKGRVWLLADRCNLVKNCKKLQTDHESVCILDGPKDLMKSKT